MPLFEERFLRQNSAGDKGFFDAGEIGVEAAEGVGELRVVDGENVEHRGVEVAEVDRVFGDVVAEVVGAAKQRDVRRAWWLRAVR